MSDTILDLQLKSIAIYPGLRSMYAPMFQRPINKAGVIVVLCFLKLCPEDLRLH